MTSQLENKKLQAQTPWFAANHLAVPVSVCDAELYDSAPAQSLLEKHARLPHPHRCRFGIAELIVDKNVFDPSLTNVSPFLLETIDFLPSERVLDMFSGSGSFGINAALSGASVVAVDVSSAAVACATKNAALNKVTATVDVRLGTLSTCLRDDELFDLVIANPPLLPGDPVDVLSATVFDPELSATLDLITRLPKHLAPSGRCYLLTSDVFDRMGYDVDRLCRSQGLESSIVAKIDLSYESYRVHRILWDCS